MNYAPQTYQAQPIQFRNGSPCWGKDAGEVDRYTAYLATRRWLLPAIVGWPLTSDLGERKVTLFVPAYTAGLRIIYLATGRGGLRVTCDGDDTFYTLVPIDGGGNGLGAGSEHTILWATPGQSGQPKDATDVAGDGEDRSLLPTPDGHPIPITLTFRLYDESADTVAKLWYLAVVVEPYLSTL